MAPYELVLFSGKKPVRQVSQDCADDLDALEAARKLCGEYSIEIYCQDRLVARVKRNDEPLNVRDRYSG